MNGLQKTLTPSPTIDSREVVDVDLNVLPKRSELPSMEVEHIKEETYL